MLIVTELPIVPASTLTELNRGMSVNVNELPLIVNVRGLQPPEPLNCAEKEKVFLPSES
ncbi:hypothetical protein PQE94_gp21 [Streptococcus phage CHPC640]|uniref:Uncharacterized protein n=1 Tax=Streptococcus phage CHPC640 TaxID=2365037 RepID=A0A3G8F6M2_9CAUD|nr:hypothetical protein PQE94_gp21 [Streptococcus phage CHPC640]AZF90414.1 hypothetical protein CHPC640_0021 [Streptococcus phage CHPC640]